MTEDHTPFGFEKAPRYIDRRFEPATVAECRPPWVRLPDRVRLSARRQERTSDDWHRFRRWAATLHFNSTLYRVTPNLSS